MTGFTSGSKVTWQAPGMPHPLSATLNRIIEAGDEVLLSVTTDGAWGTLPATVIVPSNEVHALPAPAPTTEPRTVYPELGPFFKGLHMVGSLMSGICQLDPGAATRLLNDLEPIVQQEREIDDSGQPDALGVLYTLQAMLRKRVDAPPFAIEVP